MRIPGKCMLKLMKGSFGRKRHNAVITYESNYFVTQKSDTPGLACISHTGLLGKPQQQWRHDYIPVSSQEKG